MLPPMLQRFFAKYEFTTPYLACCSDVEPLMLSELLAYGDDDALQRWASLRLSYTETQGLPALRQAIANKLYSHISPEQLVVLAPEEGVYLTMRALLQPGDQVVVQYPGYQSLYAVAQSMGCQVLHWEPRLVPDTAQCVFDVSSLKGLLSPSTKMVVVNFPHNPTGAVLDLPDWQQLLGACEAAGCWLFSDEMYRTLELDPSRRPPNAADSYPKAISLAGCSKALALPGLRLGWLACQDAALLQRVMELKDYTTICAAAPSEVLALMAVRAMDSIVARSMAIIRDNIAAFQLMQSARAPSPSHLAPATPAFLPAVRLMTGEPIDLFCDRLAAAEGVLLLPASVYDHDPSTAAGHFRLGLGRKNFKDCMARLAVFLERERADSSGAVGAPAPS
ncbi:hypothetical protein QJQ45_000808 [Haematococcus lacustris]|nr:hypothetical protein QJQ45_000808 [Haematococcus lacustris]